MACELPSRATDRQNNSFSRRAEVLLTVLRTWQAAVAAAAVSKGAGLAGNVVLKREGGTVVAERGR